MRNSLKPKIFFVLGVIFFLTSMAAKISNIYSINKSYENRDLGIKVINTLNRDKEGKILELINTMDEAVNYLNNDDISYEVKKQLTNDLINSVSAINYKLNINDDVFVGELNKLYNNLNQNKNINWDVLVKLYKEWKASINYF